MKPLKHPSHRALAPAHPLPRAARRVAAAGLSLSLAASLGACGLHIGQPTPTALPQAPSAEVARDTLARQASLIVASATIVADSDADPSLTGLAATIASTTTDDLTALGGVWEPWPTGAPSQAPTATPLATPDPTTDAAALLTTLADGVALARNVVEQSATTSTPALEAYLATALTWSVHARLLAQALGTEVPDVVTAAPRGENAQGVDATVLRTYDAARYALEEVAARSGQDTTVQAHADLDTLRQTVRAALDAGVEDTRLPAYARATTSSSGADAAGSDAAWAAQAWLAVCQAELVSAAKSAASAASATASPAGTATTSPATASPATASPEAEQPAAGRALDAAIDAAARAIAWGADPSSVLATTSSSR